MATHIGERGRHFFIEHPSPLDLMKKTPRNIAKHRKLGWISVLSSAAAKHRQNTANYRKTIQNSAKQEHVDIDFDSLLYTSKQTTQKHYKTPEIGLGFLGIRYWPVPPRNTPKTLRLPEKGVPRLTFEWTRNCHICTKINFLCNLKKETTFRRTHPPYEPRPPPTVHIHDLHELKPSWIPPP